MKDIVVSAILIAVGITGLTNVDQIQRLYDKAYSADAAPARSLDRCPPASDRDRVPRGDCYVMHASGRLISDHAR